MSGYTEKIDLIKLEGVVYLHVRLHRKIDLIQLKCVVYPHVSLHRKGRPSCIEQCGITFATLRHVAKKR